MSESSQKTHFIIGNVIMTVALLMLFFMDTLSQHLGLGAVGLWMVLAGTGMYFLMKDKRTSKLPD
jgi:uncharacterized membrane protein